MGSPTESKILAVAPKFTAFLSICGSTFIIQKVLRSRRRRRHTMHRIMLGLSMCDVLVSIWYFAGTWAIPAGTLSRFGDGETETIFWAAGDQNGVSCNVSGFFNQFAVASPLYNATLAWFFLLTVYFGWDDRRLARIEWMFHVIPVGYAILTATFAAITNLYGHVEWTCWILPNELFDDTKNLTPIQAKFQLIQWIFLFGVVWICVVFVTIIFVLLFRKMKELETKMRRYSQAISLTRKLGVGIAGRLSDSTDPPSRSSAVLVTSKDEVAGLTALSQGGRKDNPRLEEAPVKESFNETDAATSSQREDEVAVSLSRKVGVGIARRSCNNSDAPSHVSFTVAVTNNKKVAGLTAGNDDDFRPEAAPIKESFNVTDVEMAFQPEEEVVGDHFSVDAELGEHTTGDKKVPGAETLIEEGMFIDERDCNADEDEVKKEYNNRTGPNEEGTVPDEDKTAPRANVNVRKGKKSSITVSWLSSFVGGGVGVGGVGGSRSKQYQEHSKSRKIAIQGMLFVVAFYIAWLFPTINRIIELVARSKFFIIKFFDAFLVPLQGFLNFAIYIRPRLSSYRMSNPEVSFWVALRTVTFEADD